MGKLTRQFGCYMKPLPVSDCPLASGKPTTRVLSQLTLRGKRVWKLLEMGSPDVTVQVIPQGSGSNSILSSPDCGSTTADMKYLIDECQCVFPPNHAGSVTEMSVEQQRFSVLLALIEMDGKDFYKSVQHLERVTGFEDVSQWQCIRYTEIQ